MRSIKKKKKKWINECKITLPFDVMIIFFPPSLILSVMLLFWGGLGHLGPNRRPRSKLGSGYTTGSPHITASALVLFAETQVSNQTAHICCLTWRARQDDAAEAVLAVWPLLQPTKASLRNANDWREQGWWMRRRWKWKCTDSAERSIWLVFR